MSEFNFFQLFVAAYLHKYKFLRSLVGGNWVYWQSRNKWILLTKDGN